MGKKLVEKTVEDFVDQVASDSPAPGGGSVAALSAALGAGLLVMAIRISTKKEADKDAHAVLSGLLPQLEKEKNRLVELVDEDTAAFNQVMAAFALPKWTDVEKAKRSGAVQAAFRNAASVPMETMQCALRVLDAGQVVAARCSPNVASDVGTGIRMAYAGLQGASYNVKINLGAIKDEVFKSGLEKKLGVVLDAAEKANSGRLGYVFSHL